MHLCKINYFNQTWEIFYVNAADLFAERLPSLEFLLFALVQIIMHRNYP